MKKLCMLLFISVSCYLTSSAQKTSFTILPLGVYGGSDEGNLSSYLIAPQGDTAFIALDAGTLYDGLRAGRRRHFFKMHSRDFLQNRVKGYLISHPHLDHVAGLIVNSPEDNPKNIYALPFCIKTLKTKYFTWSSWANFANEGEQPALKKYTYSYLKSGEQTPLKNTRMSVVAYQLSHAVPGKSTAFLINKDKNYFLYLGDTGDDSLEQSNLMHTLWQTVAPLIRNHQLKGISIECSYPEVQPDNHLFGHLKPSLLFRNLNILDSLAGGTATHPAIAGLPIIIAHIKPAGANEKNIRSELLNLNQLGVKLIFPKRGKKIEL